MEMIPFRPISRLKISSVKILMPQFQHHQQPHHRAIIRRGVVELRLPQIPDEPRAKIAPVQMLGIEQQILGKFPDSRVVAQPLRDRQAKTVLFFGQNHLRQQVAKGLFENVAQPGRAFEL